MSDTSAGGGGQVAMHGGHPFKYTFQGRTRSLGSKVTDDLVEILAFDDSCLGLDAAKGGSDRFKEPEDFLNRLSMTTLGEQLLRSIQRLLEYLNCSFSQCRETLLHKHGRGLAFPREKIRWANLVANTVF